MTINLADAHYLKLGFALQMTEEAGEEEVDTAEAIDLAIDQYPGMDSAELETEKGRLKAKAELLEKIEKAYNVEDKHLVMGLYFTSFVTQSPLGRAGPPSADLPISRPCGTKHALRLSGSGTAPMRTT